ncbi:MAG: ankyrin repeat domain-containing protein [Janthinobacterium lividum]
MTIEDISLWDDNTPEMQFYRAVTEGDFEQVKAFLDQGGSADTLSYDGSSILRRAAQLGHIQVARLLIDRGANINFRDGEGYSALMAAA